MWDVRACRSCLSTAPSLEKLGEQSKRMYTIITGIEIKDGDGYPTFFCLECRFMIKKALLFRRRCRRAYAAMKNLMIAKKQVTFSDIQTINRKQLCLESKIGCFQDNNSGFFSLNTDFVLEKFEPLESSYISAVEIAPVTNINNDEVVQTLLKEEVKATEVEPKVEDVTETDDMYQDMFDEIQEETPENIDLDDVFKDLKFENQDDDDDLKSVDFDFKPKPKDKKLKQHMKDGNFKQLPYRTNTTLIGYMLSLADIKVLSTDEQLEALTIKRNAPQFKSARYKCFICVTVFPEVSKFIKHANHHNVSGSAKYCCDLCKCKFFLESNYQKHMAEEHLYQYTCKLCMTKYYSLGDYILHTKNHAAISKEFQTKHVQKRLLSPEEMAANERYSDTLPIVCPVCNAMFAVEDHYVKHSKRHVEPIKFPNRIMCDICKVWFSSKQYISRHMKNVHMYLYTCAKCNKKSKASIVISQHAIKCVGGPAVCELCNKVTKSGNSLDIHRRCAHPTVYCRWHCAVCAMPFTSPESLYAHQLYAHYYILLSCPGNTDSDSYCKHCEINFVGRQQYEEHCLTMDHEESKEFTNACLGCKKRFDTAELFQMHKLHCGTQKPDKIKCKFCDVETKSVITYRKHMLTMHASLRGRDRSMDYILCEECGVSFHPVAINRHRKKHLQQNTSPTLRCEICHQEFQHDKIKYVLHMITQHTVKPFMCVLCDKRFEKRGECRVHILKVHAPARPFSCEHCHREFSHMDYLNEHSKKIHNIKIKRNFKKSAMQKRFVTFAHMKIDVSLVDRSILDDVPLKMSDYLERKCFPIDNKYDYFITTPLEEHEKEELIKPEEKKPRKRKLVDTSYDIEPTDEINTIKDEMEPFIVKDHIKPKIYIENKKPYYVIQKIQQKKETHRKGNVSTHNKHKQETSTHEKQKQVTSTHKKVNEQYQDGCYTHKYSKPERGQDMPNLLDDESNEVLVKDSETNERFGFGEGEEILYGLADSESQDTYIIDNTDYDADGDDNEGLTMEAKVTEDGLVIGGNEPLEVIEQDGERYVMLNGVLYRIET